MLLKVTQSLFGSSGIPMCEIPAQPGELKFNNGVTCLVAPEYIYIFFVLFSFNYFTDPNLESKAPKQIGFSLRSPLAAMLSVGWEFEKGSFK